MAIRPDGSLWAWGGKGAGKIGLAAGVGSDASIRGSAVPLQVGDGTSWRSEAAGEEYSLGLRADGTLWTWGSSSTFNLSLEKHGFLSSPLPVQIGTAANWESIAGSPRFSLGIRTDGTLWAWGNNRYGQLANGEERASGTFQAADPAPVGKAANWRTAVPGFTFCLGTRTDGTLWSWGNNKNGQLGDGTTTSRLEPVQVGTATNWRSAAAGHGHSLAIRTDGTLWAWGLNSRGQLGDGTTTNRSEPVEVGTAANWRSVAAGNSFTLAVRTDGTLWAWGNNQSGQLGEGGTTTEHHRPVQVGTATNWRTVVAGGVASGYFGLASRADGTLWSWGTNNDGQLGNGTYESQSSPIQVGSITVREARPK